MPSAALAAVPVPDTLSPPPQHHHQYHRGRLRSPLAANGGGGGNFELRHWRTPLKRAPSCPPPAIEIPTGGEGEGGGHGYTSLRDILSSSPAKAGSPAAACGVLGGAGSSCGDIHMIRHPLVKHAAYAYLQMTPSAREDPAAARRSRRWRGPLCRLLLGCLSFFGALFRP
ncbi:uncharacterized protein LOC100824838 [Brachypodium distachyon]|uniref:Uncharacterized protein n=1 Tax=Brachypodium distachyon TaxID=15368 RepID=I1IU75_BRADI|nr:uncharacterized protein LOC100824838 [Brachypodium distachyon]KQJ92172.1 hypothetical protein BRADI_4g42060v3 [Brachypodium distachyon]|eukprot:XP_003577022.1 uncharacterized protein LOC100824838 [Brachypodium distachyon]